jgi:hypothetical protein
VPNGFDIGCVEASNYNNDDDDNNNNNRSIQLIY